MYGDSGFVPSRFLNDSLGVTEHFMVELLLDPLPFVVANVPLMGRVWDEADVYTVCVVPFVAVDIGLLVFSLNAPGADEINFFTVYLFVAASDDGEQFDFLLFKLAMLADTTTDSLSALLAPLWLVWGLLLLLLLFWLLVVWLIALLLLLLLVVFFRLNLLLLLLFILF